MIALPGPKVGVKGYFKIEVITPAGLIRKTIDWFPNLITDVGLNRMGQGSFLTACHVGTGNTAPAFADTALVNYVAGTTTRQADTEGAQSSPPYYAWRRITYRFAAFPSNVNIAEVGIATQAASAGALYFSRALILDEFAAPTTVTILAGEQLDITYELRLYPDLVDRTGTITISGSGIHDYTIRPSSVTSATTWAQFLGNTVVMNPFTNSDLSVHSGAIGAVTSGPSGSSASVSVSTAAYSNNSLLRQGSGSFSLNNGNFVGGILSVSFRTTLGRWQYQLAPAIDKTNTKTLSLTNQISWTRYVP